MLKWISNKLQKYNSWYNISAQNIADSVEIWQKMEHILDILLLCITCYMYDYIWLGSTKNDTAMLPKAFENANSDVDLGKWRSRAEIRYILQCQRTEFFVA